MATAFLGDSYITRNIVGFMTSFFGDSIGGIFSVELFDGTIDKLSKTSLLQKISILTNIFKIMQLVDGGKVYPVVQTIIDSGKGDLFTDKTKFEEVFTFNGFSSILNLIFVKDIPKGIEYFVNNCKEHRDSIKNFHIFRERVFNPSLKELIRVFIVFVLSVCNKDGFKILSRASYEKDLNGEERDALENLFFSINSLHTQLCTVNTEMSEDTKALAKKLKQLSTKDGLVQLISD
ncbi:Hypothetical predicted protein [Paramuricea clavata]|uniref:Uncharacterized protein n=1 Tax=Paramuricea clavata TaxID=317549 RepID=A0A7D9J050_PARCT|nr:Hypothetical predicted protein [Paramuricea clavata]